MYREDKLILWLNILTTIGIIALSIVISLKFFFGGYKSYLDDKFKQLSCTNQNYVYPTPQAPTPV
jgi:hypothetical protein